MNDTENNNGVSGGDDAYIDEISLKNSGPWRIALISSAILIMGCLRRYFTIVIFTFSIIFVLFILR